MFAADIAAVWLAGCLGLALVGGVVAAGALPELGRFAPAFGFPLALSVLGLAGLWVGRLSATLGLVTGLGVLGVALTAAARWTDWRGRFRRGWPAVAVFVGAFCFVLGVRLLDPAVDPASGEKFLDFGLLRAHIRATAIPAEDIWFAGKPFSYYYGGHLTYALVARLTGTPARYAYNLALATNYAALVTAAYGLAGALGRRSGAGRPAALAAVFLVGLASNLTTSVRLFLWALPDAVPGAITALVPRAEGWLTLHPLDFHYWRASRVVPGMITEFPLFAYLNGDLHAHMLAAPFSLLAVACLYASTRTDGPRRRRVLLLVALPAVAGVVTATNAWSLPVVAGLTWLTLYFGPADRGRAPGLGRATVAALLAVAVAVLAVAWSLPVWLASAGAGRTVGFLPTRSPLWSLLLVHGLFLAAVGPFLWRRLPLGGTRRRGVAVAVALVVAAGTAWRAAGVALFGALVVAAWVVLERARGDTTGRPVGYETVLALGAFGLVALLELVYLQEPAAPGRFNTLFKLSASVWVLLGVAGAVVVGRVLARRRPLGAGRFPSVDARPLVIALLLVAAGPYAAGATVEWATYQDPDVRTPDDPTLDALAFAHDRHPGRMAAIEWLDARSGTPTLLSAPGTDIDDGYRWVNAPSSLTGLPTVVGWRHEVGYRGREAYWGRVDDVRRTFTGSRTARHRLLRSYDVEYVYYGPIERGRYGTGLFDDDPALTVAFENRAVTVYRVRSSALVA